MGIVRVQFVQGSGGSSSASATWSRITSNGNLLIAIVSLNGTGTINTPANWISASSTSYNAGAGVLTIYYINNASPRSGAETFTVSGGSGSLTVELAEYSGTGDLDKIATSSGSSTTCTTGTTATTLHAGELVVGAVAQEASAIFSAPINGFSLVDTVNFSTSISTGFLDLIVTTTGTYVTSVTSTSNSAFGGVIATFISTNPGNGLLSLTGNAAAVMRRQIVSNTSTSSSISVTPSIPTVDGNTLIAVFGLGNNTIPTPPANWVLAVNSSFTLGQTRIYYWANAPSVSASQTWSYTPSGNSVLVFIEYAGLVKSPLDKVAIASSGTPTSTGDTGTTLTTAVSPELIITAIAGSATQSNPTGGFSFLVNATVSGFTVTAGEQLVDLKTTYREQVTLGTSVANSGCIATFMIPLLIGDGGMVLSGIADVLPTYKVTGVGGLSFSDVAEILPKYLYAMSGNISLGSVLFIPYDASGSVIVTGTSSTLLTFKYIQTGGLTTSNISEIIISESMIATGGLLLANSAVSILTDTYTPLSVAVTISNSANTILLFLNNVSGNIRVDGVSGIYVNYIYIGVGGLNVGGFGIIPLSRGTGGLEFSGGVEDAGNLFTTLDASGGLFFSNSGVESNYVIITTVTGSIAIGGSSFAAIAPPSGGSVSLGGSSEFSIIAPSGRLRITGSASVARVYAGKGGLFIQGTATYVSPSWQTIASGSLVAGDVGLQVRVFYLNDSQGGNAELSNAGRYKLILRHIGSGNIAIAGTVGVAQLFRADGYISIAGSSTSVLRTTYNSLGKAVISGSASVESSSWTAVGSGFISVVKSLVNNTVVIPYMGHGFISFTGMSGVESSSWTYLVTPTGLVFGYPLFLKLVSGFGPLAWWSLGDTSGTVAVDDGRVMDSGAYQGSVTLGYAGIVDYSGLAASFSDIGQGHVSIPDNVLINNGTSYSKRSICLWFLATGVVSRQVLYCEGDINSGYVVYLQNNLIYAGAYNSPSPIQWHNYQSASVTSGRRHFVVLTVDYNNGLDLYLDGVRIGLSQPVPSPVSGHPQAIIGARINGTRFHTGRASGAGNYFAGIMQHVMLFDYILTGLQIFSLWDDGSNNVTATSATNWTGSGGIVLRGTGSSQNVVAQTSMTGSLVVSGEVGLFTKTSVVVEGLSLVRGSAELAFSYWTYQAGGKIEFAPIGAVLQGNAFGSIVIGGGAEVKIVYEVFGNGGISLVGEVIVNFDLEAIQQFTWDVSEGILRFFRVTGKCKPANCPPVGGGCDKLDGTVGSTNFVTTVIARNATEVCQILARRNFNAPINAIDVFSLPALNKDILPTDDVTCNNLLPVVLPNVSDCPNLLDIHAKVGGKFGAFAISKETYVGGGRVGFSNNTISFLVANNWLHIATGGLNTSNNAIIFSSRQYFYQSIGKIEIAGNAELGNLGVSRVSGATAAVVVNLRPVFGVAVSTVLTPTTRLVNSLCCIGDIPTVLFVKHQIFRSLVLSQFLKRNNFSIPSPVKLLYSTEYNAWYNTLHYVGDSLTGGRESWDVLFEFGCVTNVSSSVISNDIWKFSMIITNRNDKNESFISKLIVLFDPSLVCAARGGLDFSFLFNTRTLQTTPVTIQTSVFHDGVKAFNSVSFRNNPNLIFDVSAKQPILSNGSIDITDHIKSLIPL